jgi:hypothetical protein
MRQAYLDYARNFSIAAGSPLDFYRLLDKRMPVDIFTNEPRKLILRSRLEHGPLATLLKKAEEAPSVRGRRRKYGYVEQIERYGPLVFIHCTLRSPKKVRPPEGGIGDAEILMGWDSKLQVPTIRHVMVTEGDLMAPSAVAV